MEGYPYTIKTDLRYYLDSWGRFTPQLRAHYAPWKARSQRQAYVKAGDSWMVLDFNLLLAGMVFKVIDADGKFDHWRDDNSPLMFAMENARMNCDGVWFARVRKPTQQELLEA